ncbi:MAG: molybdenum cofactor guanylyltransferase [Chloroflexi bacterium]|nr:molybdenum cofactor guanylyltransferase [Chloroflexota bacterium]
MDDVTSLILAGGRSTRLGLDKALLRFEGETLIERVVARLAPFSERVIIVTSLVGLERLKGLAQDGVTHFVTDIFPEKGSLGGIYSGLVASNSFYSLAVACDMPFLSASLLQHMISLAEGFDVVIPRVDGTLEPLHAVYSKNCLGPMRSLLKNNVLKIIDFFPDVKVRYLEEVEIDPFDPDRLSFFNINTPADLERAEELSDSGGAERG